MSGSSEHRIHDTGPDEVSVFGSMDLDSRQHGKVVLSAVHSELDHLLQFFHNHGLRDLCQFDQVRNVTILELPEESLLQEAVLNISRIEIKAD